MTNKTFTAAERQQIAAGWQTSGMSQPAYAALHGISDRTLREWTARHAAPEAPVDAVDAFLRVLRRTIAELERMVEGLGTGTTTGDEATARPPEQHAAVPTPAAPAPEAQPVKSSAAQPADAVPEILTATPPAAPAAGTAKPREVGFLFELDEE